MRFSKVANRSPRRYRNNFTLLRKRRYRRTKDATSCYATPRIRRMQRGRPTRLMHRLAHVTTITSRATFTRCCFQHHGHGTRRIFPRAECSSIDLFFFLFFLFFLRRRKFLKVCFFFFIQQRRNREEKVSMIARNKGKANDSNGNNRREKKNTVRNKNSGRASSMKSV